MREEHASLYCCVFVCMLVVCVAVRVFCFVCGRGTVHCRYMYVHINYDL